MAEAAGERLPGRPMPRKKKMEPKELEDRIKELRKGEKLAEREKKEQEKNSKREKQQHGQILTRTERSARRDTSRREMEAKKLDRGLEKVHKEVSAATTKRDTAVDRVDQKLEDLRTKQAKLEEDLVTKIRNAAQAKGHFAHVEFASNVMAKDNVVIPLDGVDEDDEGEEEHQLREEAEELRTANQHQAEENGKLRLELEQVHLWEQQEAARREKLPPFAFIGGQLDGISGFFNLRDAGLSESLGPGFSFFANIRYDETTRSSHVIDFGNGQGQDNIHVGNWNETNSLVFTVYQGSLSETLFIDDFWPLGESHDYLFSVHSDGLLSVQRDGEVIARKQGHALRPIVERSNLYVGRSNWETDSLFKGTVSNIKVWCREVEWNATQEHQLSEAEQWIVKYVSEPSGLVGRYTYPSGIEIDFERVSRSVRDLIVSNHEDRARMVQEIETGNHMRLALQTYQVCDRDMNGYLSWDNGELCDYITTVFDDHELVLPNEEQMYYFVQKFDSDRRYSLDSRECLCLADAILRTIFFSEDIPSEEACEDALDPKLLMDKRSGERRHRGSFSEVAEIPPNLDPATAHTAVNGQQADSISSEGGAVGGHTLPRSVPSARSTGDLHGGAPVRAPYIVTSAPPGGVYQQPMSVNYDSPIAGLGLSTNILGAEGLPSARVVVAGLPSVHVPYVATSSAFQSHTDVPATYVGATYSAPPTTVVNGWPNGAAKVRSTTPIYSVVQQQKMSPVMAPAMPYAYQAMPQFSNQGSPNGATAVRSLSSTRVVHPAPAPAEGFSRPAFSTMFGNVQRQEESQDSEKLIDRRDGAVRHRGSFLEMNSNGVLPAVTYSAPPAAPRPPGSKVVLGAAADSNTGGASHSNKWQTAVSKVTADALHEYKEAHRDSVY